MWLIRTLPVVPRLPRVLPRLVAGRGTRSALAMELGSATSPLGSRPHLPRPPPPLPSPPSHPHPQPDLMKSVAMVKYQHLFSSIGI